MRILLTVLIGGYTILRAQTNGGDIIRGSLAVAGRSWTARQNYTYRERSEARHLDPQGRVKSAEVNESQAVRVNSSTIVQTVSHNGGPPTPVQKKRDEENLRKRRNETTVDRAARICKEKEDRAFLDELPQAFSFHLTGEQTVNGRLAYVLDAVPQPGYTSHSRFSSTFRRVHGRLWVDKEDLGLVKVEAYVTEPFSMGLILARVQPGSQIFFEQTRVADAIWLPLHIEIRAAARILFLKNYQMDQVITYSQYRTGQSADQMAFSPTSSTR